jgi:acyl dehydratase
VTGITDIFAPGTHLPPVDVPVTTRSVIAASLATRDYQDVHHDPKRARELGSPDIFMNILTTNGYIERYVDLWSARVAEIESIDIRLGASNFPGDTMRLSGRVDAVEGDRATLKVIGSNARGAHVTATVVIRRCRG